MPKLAEMNILNQKRLAEQAIRLRADFTSLARQNLGKAHFALARLFTFIRDHSVLSFLFAIFELSLTELWLINDPFHPIVQFLREIVIATKADPKIAT